MFYKINLQILAHYLCQEHLNMCLLDSLCCRNAGKEYFLWSSIGECNILKIIEKHVELPLGLIVLPLLWSTEGKSL